MRLVAIQDQSSTKAGSHDKTTAKTPRVTYTVKPGETLRVIALKVMGTKNKWNKLYDLNRDFRERYAVNAEVAARAQSYELAARMQLAAPEAVDFSSEPRHVLDCYGIGDATTDDFGRQLLLARRLAERGVRFIQVCHAGGGNGAWDAHGDIRTQAPLCRATFVNASCATRNSACSTFWGTRCSPCVSKVPLI